MDELLNFIKQNEGFRSKPYRCPAGKWTIGYGYNAEAHGIPAWCVDAILSGRGVSEQEAERLLIDEVAESISACKRIVPGFNRLTHARQMAMVDMCFNLGAAGLAKFKVMLGCIGRGDYEAAALSPTNPTGRAQTENEGAVPGPVRAASVRPRSLPLQHHPPRRMTSRID